MPRKTDGIEFEIHPRPTKGEDGKPLLYVRPAKGRKKSFKDLETFCNKYRNLRTGELQMVMDVVMEVVGMWLSDGYRVETPLGSFAPKLKLLGEHTDPKTVHGRDVMYAGIEFIPSKELVKEGGQNRKGYRKSQEPVGNSQMHDQQAMDEALRRSMRMGYTTIPRNRFQMDLYYDGECFIYTDGTSKFIIHPNYQIKVNREIVKLVNFITATRRTDKKEFNGKRYIGI